MSVILARVNWFRHPALVSTVIVLVVFEAIFILHNLDYFTLPELAIYDYHVRNRPPVQVDDPRIVLVVATEASIQKYSGPLPDTVLAQLLQVIASQNPRVIGVDLYRASPVPIDGSGSEPLRRVLEDHPNIIWSFVSPTGTDPGVPPPAYLKMEPGRIGCDCWGFNDQSVRRGILYMNLADGTHYDALSTQLARLYLKGENPPPAKGLNFKSFVTEAAPRIIPHFSLKDSPAFEAETAEYRYMLDYAGPRQFKTYSIAEILSGQVPDDFARDRIVIIGSVAPSTNDFWNTPLGTWLNPHESGILIHAQIINQLLRAATIGDLSPQFLSVKQQASWLFFFCVIGGVAAYFIRSPWQLVLLLGLFGWATWESTVYAFAHAIWIPAFPPPLGMAFSAALVTIYIAYMEKSDRQALMDLFKRNVSRGVAESLWEKRNEFLERGRPTPQKLTATVLFTDLKDFTTISEGLDPGALLEWLNTYMALMADQVDRHGGVVMKYIGDALMAVFGVPVPRKTEAELDRDAVNAVRCALAMRDALEKFNAEQALKGKPPLGMRVGIFTGSLVAGCLGSDDRLEYSTLGDTVNTASRLESFDKTKGMDPPTHCRILIGEPTLNRIGPGFATLKIDTIRMKGKMESTTIYRVLHEVKSEDRHSS